MRIFDSGWQDGRGLGHYVHGWEPDGQAKAAVALIHGLGEHVNRYAPVGEAFTNAAYALIGMDLRGHGRSGGPRGHVPNYESLLDDIADLLALISARHPRLPLFLYGHSLGGNLVLNYVLRRKPEIVGAIVTAPWLRLVSPPPAGKVMLARMAERLVPGLTHKSGLEPTAFSRDPAIVRAYVADPLVHDRISARLFTGAYDSGRWALEHAEDFPLPLLLMHGTADRITSPQASREFARRAGAKVEWREWDGWYHEIHNDPGKEQVFSVMIGWMDALLSKR